MRYHYLAQKQRTNTFDTSERLASSLRVDAAAQASAYLAKSWISYGKGIRELCHC